MPPKSTGISDVGAEETAAAAAQSSPTAPAVLH